MITRVLLTLLALAGALFLYATRVYTDIPVDPSWQVDALEDTADAAVTVRFTGTSTLLFSDGDTKWLVDGWFSRFGPLRLALGKIGPDLLAIERGLAANGIDTLDAVIPVHSHFDHAMDAPDVARMTGATLYGSESTANIARGVGLPESQIVVLQDRIPFTLGKFVITPVVTPHFEFPDEAVRERALGNPVIDAPLVPPVSALDYRVGTAYSLHVAHPAGSFLIVGSAGFSAGALDGYSADMVFLGVGGIGSQTDAYREAFWRETVDAVGATTVVPIHYDTLTGPAEGPFRGPVNLVAFLSPGGDKTAAFLQGKAAQLPAVKFKTLPRFAEAALLR